MNYPALISGVVLLVCAVAAVADYGPRTAVAGPGQQPEMVAIGGGGFPFFANTGGPAGHPNANAGDNPYQRDQQARARARDHNEGFGYGFERRREKHAAPGKQGQEPRPGQQ